MFSCKTLLFIWLKHVLISVTSFIDASGSLRILYNACNYILSWKAYIDSVVPRLSLACFAMRMVKPLLSQEALKMVYCSYFHSIMSCAMLCYAMLCYAMLCYAMLCYAMLCYAMLRYAMLRYAALVM
jgi:hypothetical protein